MRYLCRISYEDDAYTLQDILIGYLESFPAGYPLGYLAGYPVCYRQIRLGTRCSPVALHPAYSTRLRPRFCALNDARIQHNVCLFRTPRARSARGRPALARSAGGAGPARPSSAERPDGTGRFL
jgi:hypothetical protein